MSLNHSRERKKEIRKKKKEKEIKKEKESKLGWKYAPDIIRLLPSL